MTLKEIKKYMSENWDGITVDDFIFELCDRIKGFEDLLNGKAVIMPVEPTDEMVRAGEEGYVDNDGVRALSPIAEAYCAMISNRPYKES
jgi:hypothetical protein